MRVQKPTERIEPGSGGGDGASRGDKLAMGKEGYLAGKIGLFYDRRFTGGYVRDREREGVTAALPSAHRKHSPCAVTKYLEDGASALPSAHRAHYTRVRGGGMET